MKSTTIPPVHVALRREIRLPIWELHQTFFNKGGFEPQLERTPSC
jgi:hypothetical protein